jgi:hypothetical protein
MISRCTAQFCLGCAAPWKTCSCPWFNYQRFENEDSLGYESASDESVDPGDSTSRNERSVEAKHGTRSTIVNEHSKPKDGYLDIGYTTGYGPEDVRWAPSIRERGQEKPSKPTLGRTATYVY